MITYDHKSSSRLWDVKTRQPLGEPFVCHSSEQAKAKFAQAREWDANVAFGENEINTLGAIELTKQARELLEEGKTEEAKAKFAKARKLDAKVVFGDEGL
ncbi:MAG: hypothetical protein KAI83_18020 [Thiomargarita sp.]|nr:hypothetical protein [Thiomargarita sp.]